MGDGIVWFGKYSVGCIATGSWKREWTVLPLATAVALQTMWASANKSQDCGLLFLIEHLHVLCPDRVLFKFSLSVTDVYKPTHLNHRYHFMFSLSFRPGLLPAYFQERIWLSVSSHSG